MTSPPREGARVLALVATPRYAGSASIDGWGLCPGGFESWDIRRHGSLDAKARSLAARARLLILRHRPGHIVLGVPIRDDWRCVILRKYLHAFLAARNQVAHIRESRAARRLVLGRERGPGRGALDRALVRGFFPELAVIGRRGAESVRYRSHGWEAAALAVAELVEIAPRSAFALARPPAFAVDAFRQAVMASERRHSEPAPRPLRRIVESAAPDLGVAPDLGRQCEPRPPSLTDCRYS